MTTTPRHNWQTWIEGLTEADELFNALIQVLDIEVSCSVVSRTTDAQPGESDLEDGDAYIITGSASGTDWSGFSEHDIAVWRSNAWVAFPPLTGWIAQIEDESGALVSFKGATWSALQATDGDAIHDDVPGEIQALTEKTVPADDDVILIEDSETSDGDKAKVKIGRLPPPTRYRGQNLQTGVSYELTLADAGHVVEMNNAAANDVAIPADADVDFELNTRIDVVQYGTGATGIIANSDVTLLGNPNVPGRYQMVSLWKRAANEWLVIGGIG